MNRSELYVKLDQCFNKDEVKGLCFELDIDYDNLEGRTKQAKIRELITLCERDKRIPLLIAACKKWRPLRTWPAARKKADSPQPTPVNGAWRPEWYHLAGLIVVLGGLLLAWLLWSRSPIIEIEEVFNPTETGHALEEYVSLRNSTEALQDMTGWTLEDDDNHVFEFPSFDLAPQASVKVWTMKGEDSATDLFWGCNQARWTNEGDTATLKDDQGQVIDTYTYQR